ncbi:MAG: hypothetical protein ACSW8I_07430 [bacterium]
MMKEDKRIRINKRMMAWSNGERINLVPSVWREVDDYGKTLVDYHRSLREGDEYLYGVCGVVRDECRCREYEADRYWERGMQVAALEQMMGAASRVLPDESIGFEFEDMQWLNPEEVVFWHPNVREYLRLMRRCEGYCKQNPRLWPLLESSRNHRAYRRYLSDLGCWARE